MNRALPLATVLSALFLVPRVIAQSPPPPLPMPRAPSVQPLALKLSTLNVVSARPQGPVQGEVRPTLTFSKPVGMLGPAERKAPQDIATIEPRIPGGWRWLGSASLEFVPRTRMPYSTAYRVTVHRGLRALDGSTLGADYTFNFETPRLELQQVVPHEGYQWVTPEDRFELLFNQPVAREELERSVHFEVLGVPVGIKVLKVTRIEDEKRGGEKRGFKRAGDEVRKERTEQTRYTLKATQRFPLDAAISLELPRTLHGTQGPLTMADDRKLEWKVYGAFKVLSARLG